MRPRFWSLAKVSTQASLMVKSAPVVMPKRKRSGNQAQKGVTLMARSSTIIRPTMM